MQHWCLARIKFCLFLYILFSHFLKITLSLREPSQSLNFTFTNQIYTILLDRQACPLSRFHKLVPLTEHSLDGTRPFSFFFAEVTFSSMI